MSEVEAHFPVERAEKRDDVVERMELVRLTLSVSMLETKERMKGANNEDLHYGKRTGYRVRLFFGGQNGGKQTFYKEFDTPLGKEELEARVMEEFSALFRADILGD